MLNQETLNSLKRSPIYKALESVGLNSEHLESICLYDNRDGFRLSNWSYKFSPSISPEAFYYLKPFAVLRCLLENGISSADREAAWEYVAFAEKIAEDDLAEKAKRRLQSQRAKRTRGKISTTEAPLGKLLKVYVRNIRILQPVSFGVHSFLDSKTKTCTPTLIRDVRG